MAPPQWAYQMENFVNEPDEEFVCSVCRAIFCDPVLCPCDHVFCRTCITKWLANNRNCPICRKRASNSSIKPMIPIFKNLIMKLVLKCRNKTLGCKAQFPLEGCEAHMKECEYEFVQCKNKPCQDKLFRKDIVEHETSDCPHRYIKCQKCRSKMPTSAQPENHNCIKELQSRLRRKNIILQKRNSRIKILKNEIKTLKTTYQNTRYNLSSSSSHTLGYPLPGLSPDEIMINIREIDSTSASSDSEDSSENSIIIFTNSPLDHSDDNAESESFSTYVDNDSIEYSRNESPQDVNEYRNAESQTSYMDPDSSGNEQVDESAVLNRENASADISSIAVEAPDSLYDEADGRSQSSRPNKRRPTTQKPAKRRLPPLSLTSSDDENVPVPSSRSSKRCWRLSSSENENILQNSDNLHLEAGPSSSAMADQKEVSSKFAGRSLSKNNQKHVKEGLRCTSGEADADSSAAVPQGNAVFERTLALLEQYNLESDPEWLPEYASHRGNDTTTESDSSLDADDSSSSDLEPDDHTNSESDSNDEFMQDVVPGDFMQWMFEGMSDEDDPDWHPK